MPFVGPLKIGKEPSPVFMPPNAVCIDEVNLRFGIYPILHLRIKTFEPDSSDLLQLEEVLDASRATKGRNVQPTTNLSHLSGLQI